MIIEEELIVMNKILILLVLFISACNQNTLKSNHFKNTSGPALHAIIVADTNDKNIGSGADLKNITQQLEFIKQDSGLALNLQQIIGNNFKHDEIITTINNLDINDDDVVVFYYSGHGINIDKGSKWPSMQLGEDLLDLDFVVKSLKEKKPRFFIAMSDSCNNFLEANSTRSPIVKKRGLTKNYKSLFLDYSGYIIASAAKPGQVAGGSSQQGGLYTNKFLKNLDEELSSSIKPSWHRIMEQSNSKIFFEDRYGDKKLQMPQSKVEIRSIQNSEMNVAIIPKESPQVLLEELFLRLETKRQPIKIGDKIKIKVTNKSHKAGYLFVWDINSVGELTRIFPNAIANKNLIKPNQTITIPEHDYVGFSLAMGGPVGEGIIMAKLVDEIFKQKVLSANFEVYRTPHSTLQQMREELDKVMWETGDSTVDYEVVD